MKIAITSDVHLEFGDARISNDSNADVLILAGDVCIAEDLKRWPEDPYSIDTSKKISDRLIRAMLYRDFFRDCAREFKHVVYIMGNHEHYTGEFRRSYGILKEQCANIGPNIHLLENESITIDGVKLIGTTLWTDLNKGDSLTSFTLQRDMSDYSVIDDSKHGYSNLRPATTAGVHYDSVQYIRNQLAENREQENPLPIVMVTHHAPTFMSVPPQFRGDRLLNGGYASDLSDLILDNPEIKFWVHGHMHDPVDYEVGDCRVVANPRGYYGNQTTARQLSLLTIDV